MSQRMLILCLALSGLIALNSACLHSRLPSNLSTIEKPVDIAFPTSTPSPTPTQTPTPFTSPPQARFFQISDGVILGGAWKRVQPQYPLEAQAKGVIGTVRVQITVEIIEGKVVEAKVLSGPPLLREAALQAAREWRFKPVHDMDWVYAVGTLEFKFPAQ